MNKLSLAILYISEYLKAIIYMEDGIRLIEPQNKNHVADWDRWMPDAKVGEVVATALNPVMYP